MIRTLFSHNFYPYHFFVILILTMSGIVLDQFLQKPLIIIIVMTVTYIFITLILLHAFHQYAKHTKQAVHIVDQLIRGNYHIHLDYRMNNDFAVLNQKFIHLAQNLRILTLENQMQTEQLSTVINHIESALILIDARGYINLVNRTFLTMFGGDKKSYMGQLYYKVLQKEEIHEIIQKTFLYEDNRKKSFAFHNEQEVDYFQLVSTPIMSDHNELKGVVLVFYNITELKKLELMRKDFVANVSHELKTPITSIRGFAETLLGGALDDQKFSKMFLEIIHDESKRLQSLIEHLLTLTKVEQDEPQLHKEKLSLQLLVNDISPLIEQMMLEKSIVFTTQFDKNLYLYGDQEKLKQMFINLFTNAVHYTPVKGKVSLLAKQENDHIQLKIKDTGIGIAASDLPRIFERFYRVDKARSRNTGGTGLGLSIVKHIVEGHGGKITVESKVHHGTTFTIQFPM